MLLVADVEGRVIRKWIVQADGSWKLTKLKDAQYPWRFLSCPLHPKQQEGGNSLNIPRWQRKKLGNTPTVPRYDSRRPVLEPGLRVEVWKGPNEVAILSVNYWFLEVLMSNPSLTFGYSPIFHLQRMLVYIFQWLVGNASVHQIQDWVCCVCQAG